MTADADAIHAAASVDAWLRRILRADSWSDGRDFCGLGSDPHAATPRRCRSKSPASARFAVPAATPTATITSAATSRFARSATSRDRSSIDGVIALVDRHRPLHVSIVGGEPLVRYSELNTILPAARRSAASTCSSSRAPSAKSRREWHSIQRLSIVVSIDGLQPEHDVRRTPATYDRILKHIVGHRITVHCTVTRQQVNRPGYLEEFLQFWSAQTGSRRRSGSASTRRRSAKSPTSGCARRSRSASSPTCSRCGCAIRSWRCRRG